MMLKFLKLKIATHSFRLLLKFNMSKLNSQNYNNSNIFIPFPWEMQSIFVFNYDRNISLNPNFFQPSLRTTPPLNITPTLLGWLYFEELWYKLYSVFSI